MGQGLSSRSGPAPDPNALCRDRKDDQGSWLDLPAEGRKGAAPAWPLPTPTSARERKCWTQLWHLPQAVMWERNRQFAEVAIYVRSLDEAQSQLASVASRVLLLRQQEALGLSLPGLYRNRWRIPAADTPPKRRTRATPVVDDEVANMRQRLRAVNDGGST